MKLSKLWKRSPRGAIKGKYFLTLDIGTEAIKGLLFKEEGGKIIALEYSTQYIEPSGLFGGQFLEIGLLKKAISDTIKGFKTQRTSNVGLEYVILNLPPSILKSSIYFKSMQRENPESKIREREGRSIVRNVLSQTQKDIAQEFTKKTGILAKDIRFLNVSIVEIKIDGYEAPNLSGYSGKNLDFKLITNFLLKYDFKKAERIIQNLNLNIFEIANPDKNLMLALGDEKLSGIFLDIGGKISKTTFIKNGKIQGVSEFKEGGDSFSQALSQTLGITKTEADGLKIRYSGKVLTEEVRKRIKEIFIPSTQGWFNALKLNLKEIQADKELLPPAIFIFGGGSLLPEIQEILNEGDWGDVPFLKKPAVALLSPKDLKNFEDRTNIITSPQYVPVILACYEGL